MRGVEGEKQIHNELNENENFLIKNPLRNRENLNIYPYENIERIENRITPDRDRNREQNLLDRHPRRNDECTPPEIAALLGGQLPLTPFIGGNFAYRLPGIGFPTPTDPKPVDARSLKDRLVWTSGNPRVRGVEADRRRQASTDSVLSLIHI